MAATVNAFAMLVGAGEAPSASGKKRNKKKKSGSSGGGGDAASGGGAAPAPEAAGGYYRDGRRRCAQAGASGGRRIARVVCVRGVGVCRRRRHVSLLIFFAFNSHASCLPPTQTTLSQRARST